MHRREQSARPSSKSGPLWEPLGSPSSPSRGVRWASGGLKLAGNDLVSLSEAILGGTPTVFGETRGGKVEGDRGYVHIRLSGSPCSLRAPGSFRTWVPSPSLSHWAEAEPRGPPRLLAFAPLDLPRSLSQEFVLLSLSPAISICPQPLGKFASRLPCNGPAGARSGQGRGLVGVGRSGIGQDQGWSGRSVRGPVVAVFFKSLIEIYPG